MNYDPALVASMFAYIARGFCDWCETSSLEEKPDRTAASWLCRLYGGALALPKVDPRNSDAPPDVPSLLLERARTKLAVFSGRYYREFFDPNPILEDAAVMGDIGDDLLDVYKDVRGGLLLFDKGEKIDALSCWAELFICHWGHHAAGAIFALHCLSVANQE